MPPIGKGPSIVQIVFAFALLLGPWFWIERAPGSKAISAEVA